MKSVRSEAKRSGASAASGAKRGAAKRSEASVDETKKLESESNSLVVVAADAASEAAATLAVGARDELGRDGVAEDKHTWVPRV